MLEKQFLNEVLFLFVYVHTCMLSMSPTALLPGNDSFLLFPSAFSGAFDFHCAKVFSMTELTFLLGM